MGKLLDENTTKAPFINSQTENLNLTQHTLETANINRSFETF